MLFACLFLATIVQTSCHPVKFIKNIQENLSPGLRPTNSDSSWIWGWAWGSESTVSIVDRYPPLSFPSRPASFGAELGDPLLGYVIPLSSFTRPCNDTQDDLTSARPNIGCPKLCIEGPNEPTDTWIALVQRGKCEFAMKVREAQRLGAKAVVVGGEDPEISGTPDVLLTMYSPGDSSDITIAATYIKYSDYVTLSSLIASSNTSHSGIHTLSLLITSEYSAWEWYSPIITFIIILLLPSTLTFLTLLVHRVRANRQAQRDRAPEDVVRHLPWSVWTGTGWEKHQGDEDPYADADAPPTEGPSSSQELPDAPDQQPTPDEGDNGNERNHRTISDSATGPKAWFEMQLECAICLSEFEKGDKVRVLPCHHIFHLDEVDEWLIHRKKLCPVCKADVTQPHPPNEEHTDIPPQPIPDPTIVSETTPLLSDRSAV